MDKITIGCDPEFFLVDKDTKRFISAHDIVPGTKHKPYPLKDGAVQADGTAVEFNITPSSDPTRFSDKIHSVLSQIREMVPKNYEFSFTPVAKYTRSYFDSLPEYSKELGCDPDYNPISLLPNPRPNPADVGLSTARTGAGHIHIGFTNVSEVMSQSHMWDCAFLSRGLVNSLSRFRFYWDNDRERHLLYGGNGSFRPKPYGVEFRQLSNAWLNYPELWPWLFNFTRAVVMNLKDGVTIHDFYGGHLYEYNDKSINNFISRANVKLWHKLPFIPVIDKSHHAWS